MRELLVVFCKTRPVFFKICVSRKLFRISQISNNHLVLGRGLGYWYLSIWSPLDEIRPWIFDGFNLGNGTWRKNFERPLFELYIRGIKRFWKSSRSLVSSQIFPVIAIGRVWETALLRLIPRWKKADFPWMIFPDRADRNKRINWYDLGWKSGVLWLSKIEEKPKSRIRLH